MLWSMERSVCGIDAVFLQDILKDHLRHAAGPAAEDFLSDEIFPLEIRFRCASDEEVAGPLGELGEVYGVVLIALDISIDARPPIP